MKWLVRFLMLLGSYFLFFFVQCVLCYLLLLRCCRLISFRPFSTVQRWSAMISDDQRWSAMIRDDQRWSAIISIDQRWSALISANERWAMMSEEPADFFCQVSNARFEQPWTTFIENDETNTHQNLDIQEQWTMPRGRRPNFTKLGHKMLIDVAM